MTAPPRIAPKPKSPSIAAPPPSQFESGTEGLRGVAALMVLYTHLLLPAADVDSAYSPWAGFMSIETSQGAVLLFFVLSGYVIGLTNRGDFSLPAIVEYGRRRIIRIVPLYLIAVLISAAIRPIDGVSTILGNLLFLQNELVVGTWSTPILKANTNLWSLNYEMLYYALFPLVWMTRSHWKVWTGLAAILGFAGFSLPLGGQLVATYAAGWTFWLVGFGFAQAPKPSATAVTDLPWPSLFILWMVIWNTKPMWWFCHRFELIPAHAAWMDFTYYDFILPCIALMLAATGRRPRGWKLWIWATLALPVLFLSWNVVRGRTSLTDLKFLDKWLIFAIILWFWRPPTVWLARLAPIGAISYSIYIFQRPAQWLVRDLIPLPTGSTTSFVLRLTLIVLLTIAAAYLAEKKLQPWLRRAINN